MTSDDHEEHIRQMYRERAHLVAYLAKCFPDSVIAYNDPRQPSWPLIYIQTPMGQMSWHISQADLDLFSGFETVDPDRVQWDGHSVPEKLDRLRRLTEATRP